MTLFSKYEYLKQNRLSDVIRLISVLGIDDNYSFRKNDGLTKTLNGKPKSAKDWFEIATEHPEFFKFNVAGDSVVLLFRSLVKPDLNDKREPLSIDQTQKLIDQAITLHDKQIARLQKNSFLMPIITAIIASLTTGIIAYFTLKSNNESIKNIDKKVDNIVLMMKQNSNSEKDKSVKKK
ncbi:hypothetical protein [Flavobacterium aquicola]|uniref:Uncharacterized protein n=1 Tax=Flavobacterium aquicola TaxID=1682742 RepID=A0A3E0EP78_9FLAO|nr:hypothetical protein [Flavobacterium aquicola]REH00045.1 hypothetical protein C8P67_10311 [Flavobacterium aquicola]